MTWLVAGAGHRNEMADEGIRVREERSVLDLESGRSENWPCTRSLVSQSTNTPCTPTLHSVLGPEQNTEVSDRVLSKQVQYHLCPMLNEG